MRLLTRLEADQADSETQIDRGTTGYSRRTVGCGLR